MSLFLKDFSADKVHICETINFHIQVDQNSFNYYFGLVDPLPPSKTVDQSHQTLYP